MSNICLSNHGSKVIITPAILIILDDDRSLFLPNYMLPHGRDPLYISIHLKSGFLASDYLHLYQYNTYYNYTLYKNLNTSKMAAFLSRYSYQGEPLLNQVEPIPLALIGNYLIFKMGSLSFTKKLTEELAQQNASAKKGSEKKESNENKKVLATETWLHNWMKDHGFKLGEIGKDYVALPSGGVFAEAVLGLSNCAEKLDITRFWNWQDSPIPILPPEIAPLHMGSLAQPVDLTQSHFSQRVLHTINPSALPDPTGLAATISALTAANIFRDMSAQQSVSALGNVAAELTGANERQAAAQAGENYATMANTQLEIVKAIASAAGNSSADPSLTRVGARVNYARQLDNKNRFFSQQQVSPSTSRPISQAPAPQKVASSNSAYKLVSATNQDFSPAISSSEELVFENALYGPSCTVSQPLFEQGLFKARSTNEENKFIQEFLAKLNAILKMTEVAVPYQLAKEHIIKQIGKISKEKLINFIRDKANAMKLKGDELIKELGKILKPLAKYITGIAFAVKAVLTTDLSREELLDLIANEAGNLLKGALFSIVAVAIATAIAPESLAVATAIGIGVFLEGFFESPGLSPNEKREFQMRQLEEGKKAQDLFLREHGVDPNQVYSPTTPNLPELPHPAVGPIFKLP